MINSSLSVKAEPTLYSQLVRKQNPNSKTTIPLDENKVFAQNLTEALANPNEEIKAALSDITARMLNGDMQGAIDILKPLIPNDAAIKDTSLGVAIMAKGWEKPIVFPKESAFKWLGWADKPQDLTTDSIWTAAYGYKPAAIIGAVGNSNIKPEQVKGGCGLTKKELSAKYEQAIVDFYRPIMTYLQEVGADTKDIGFAFAHSDCGVDKASREVIEQHKLKGLATTPTEYTQYLRGKECPPSEEFPNGFILADFPFPTVLTRNLTQITDYAETYGKMVGADNPVDVFGGGEHAFIQDTKASLFGKNNSIPVPVDIMKDRFGIVIPATNDKGVVTNAARKILEDVNGSPYEQYKFAFDRFLPESKTKGDIKQYDPQMATTAIIYSNLANAGKIKK